MYHQPKTLICRAKIAAWMCPVCPGYYCNKCMSTCIKYRSLSQKLICSATHMKTKSATEKTKKFLFYCVRSCHSDATVTAFKKHGKLPMGLNTSGGLHMFLLPLHCVQNIYPCVTKDPW